MVLSDEKEIVLNNLLVAVKNSIDQYEQAASIIGDDPLNGMFEELAADRRHMAHSIEGILKESGFLPAEPDPDKQSLVEIATRFKAAISDDDRTFLLDTAEQLEKHTEISLQEARLLNWPDPVKQAFVDFEARLHEKRKKIQAIRSKL